MSGALYRGFTSAAEIDQQYDQSRVVGYKQAYIEAYRRRSAAARARRAHTRLRYGPAAEEGADVFAGSDPRRPLLLFIHGGYWVALRAADFHHVALGFPEYTVVVADYGLCPGNSLPGIAAQMRRLLATLQQRRLVGAAGLVAIGHSAGGQQVGLLADAGLRGLVSLSGLFDLAPLRHSWLQPLIRLTPETVASESPLRRLPDRAPPLLTLVGAQESAEFQRQSRDYLGAWRRRGLRGEGGLIAARNHFTLVTELDDPQAPTTRRLRRFLERL
ncbi:MAG TPA: alpha/beta fold hydrolase [Nevskiaceae bacterium]|nr:alpha/beta fold hydrolase [Nevskiaceae bacterium]